MISKTRLLAGLKRLDPDAGKVALLQKALKTNCFFERLCMLDDFESDDYDIGVNYVADVIYYLVYYPDIEERFFLGKYAEIIPPAKKRRSKKPKPKNKSELMASSEKAWNIWLTINKKVL